MFIIDWFKNLGREEEKVMIPIFEKVEWTDKERGELNKFMQGPLGKTLLNEMNVQLFFAQQQAMVPQGTMGGKFPLTPEERLAIVSGMQRSLVEFVGLYAIKKEEKPFEMTNSEIDQVLANRINGNMSNFSDEIEL